MIDVLIVPYLSPLSNFKFTKSIKQLISHMNEDSLSEFNKSINICWKIQISLNKCNNTEYIYTPFLNFFDILAKNENSTKDFSNLSRLSDFCEEKRIIKLEDTLKLEISWDGSLKISKDKSSNHYSELFVKSPNLIILDNFKLQKIVISSPYISIRNEVSVKTIIYNYDQFQKRETTQFPILEITSLSKLFVKFINASGLLINKGTIITKNNGFLNSASFINIGLLKSRNFNNNLKCDISNLFWNIGKIEIFDFDIKSGIFYQNKLNEISPLIETTKINVKAIEKVELKSGSVKSTNINISSSDLFQNECEIESKKFIKIETKEFKNKGTLKVDFLEVFMDQSSVNEGVIDANKVYFNLAKNSVFSSKNTFVANTLVVNGQKDCKFENHYQFIVDFMKLSYETVFENRSPLSEEEFSLKEKPKMTAIIKKINNLIQITNSGYLVIKNGNFFTLLNNGIVISDELHISKLTQKGKLIVTNLSIKSLSDKIYAQIKNEGYIEAKNFNFVVSNLINEGTLQLFDGDFSVKSHFQDNENSIVILNNSKIELSSKSFKINGIFVIDSPKCFKSPKDFDIYINNDAKLIVKNCELNWSNFENNGLFELHNGKSKGFGIYK